MNKFLLSLLLASCHFVSYVSAKESTPELQRQYQFVSSSPSDIYEHLPYLRDLCRECSDVVEFGIRGVVSTWAILEGLATNETGYANYLGVDIALPPPHAVYNIQRIAEENGINFTFIQESDVKMDFQRTDLLMIDSLHTYCHLTETLEKHAPQVDKYIAMHDTSAPWGHQDDSTYHGDRSEYPAHIDRTKRGLWPAVEDFLAKNPDWELYERRLNNHGFTVLKRVNSQSL